MALESQQSPQLWSCNKTYCLRYLILIYVVETERERVVLKIGWNAFQIQRSVQVPPTVQVFFYVHIMKETARIPVENGTKITTNLILGGLPNSRLITTFLFQCFQSCPATCKIWPISKILLETVEPSSRKHKVKHQIISRNCDNEFAHSFFLLFIYLFFSKAAKD